jgi:hypothetical protein
MKEQSFNNRSTQNQQKYATQTANDDNAVVRKIVFIDILPGRLENEAGENNLNDDQRFDHAAPASIFSYFNRNTKTKYKNFSNSQTRNNNNNDSRRSHRMTIVRHMHSLTASHIVPLPILFVHHLRKRAPKNGEIIRHVKTLVARQHILQSNNLTTVPIIITSNKSFLLELKDEDVLNYWGRRDLNFVTICSFLEQ